MPAAGVVLLISALGVWAAVWPVKSCPRCVDLRGFSCRMPNPGLTRIRWVDGLFDRLAEGATVGPGRFAGKRECRLCRGRGKVGLLRK